MERKIDLTVGGYIFHNSKLLLIHHQKLNLWLPVGGHIDANETPDNALRREIKEEVNLDIEIIGKSSVPLGGNAKENCALPFHTNLHSVGDHDHYGLFYLCTAKNPEILQMNKEVKNFRWFSADDVTQNDIPEDVRQIALEAFRLYKQQKG
ncbi:MAG: NUDIX domain-containing protein [Nanoarchaeota archaeon]|nr:NUDIX domain-containing protein [Nanoarchaeota archaeon]